ncbi:NAD(P)H-binding protein [Dyadobacter sp. NIV53]|uniref:NmrA family NAD(P)-binding protein n=1 Tax=Dyadobacter sp. NIV53 TaxID=2861765 RepID=UPI001C86C8F4|nr:NAD(P)H-binding protein [Dyadobacter sp. NIV53]
MKVVVTGSLGNISKPLVERLIEKGHTVTVISTNPEKQTDIEALGAMAAIGSVEDTGFLTAAFKDSDAIYTMIPPNFSAPDQVERYKIIGNCYAESIQHSGVKRVVNLSSWGADLKKGTGVIVGSYHVEQILNTLSEVTVIHLRPTFFYYNLYHFINMIKVTGCIGTNYGGEDKVTIVSPNDIADAAFEEIISPATDIKIRYVASDEHTCNEIAHILGVAIGKPDLKWLTFSDEQVQATMENSGIPPNLATKLVELNASIHNGGLRRDYDLHKPAVLGKVKLEDFAKDFAKAFNQK